MALLMLFDMRNKWICCRFVHASYRHVRRVIMVHYSISGGNIVLYDVFVAVQVCSVIIFII